MRKVECIEGNLQLTDLDPIVVASAQSPTCLHLQLQCNERLLFHRLPELEGLWLGFASPNAHSEAFFLRFVASGPSHQARPLHHSAAPSDQHLQRSKGDHWCL